MSPIKHRVFGGRRSSFTTNTSYERKNVIRSFNHNRGCLFNFHTQTSTQTPFLPLKISTYKYGYRSIPSRIGIHFHLKWIIEQNFLHSRKTQDGTIQSKKELDVVWALSCENSFDTHL